MRLAIAAVLLCACGDRAARPTEYPSLDPAPPRQTYDIPEAAAPDLTAFAPPPSQPTGEPVVITWRAPAVGDTRTRTLTQTALYTTRWPLENDRRRQRTVQRFEVVERVTAVHGADVIALDVNVKDATEVIELDGPPRTETLLFGDYSVLWRAAGGPLEISRGTTGVISMGTREQEELSYLYGGELGRPMPLLALLREEPLRVGETLELDEPAKRLLAGGEPLPVPMYLHLTSLANGIASYRVVFSSHVVTESDDPTTDDRAVEIAIELGVADGRVHRLRTVDARGDSSRASLSTSRSETDVRFAY